MVELKASSVEGRCTRVDVCVSNFLPGFDKQVPFVKQGLSLRLRVSVLSVKLSPQKTPRDVKKHCVYPESGDLIFTNVP